MGGSSPALDGPNDVIPGRVGQMLTFDLTGSDVDADPLQYFVEIAPAGADLTNVVANVATFQWTPRPNDAGTTSITVGLTDGFENTIYNVRLNIEGPVRLIAWPGIRSYSPDISVPYQVAYLNNNDQTVTVYETIEAFANDFDGPLIYSDGPGIAGTIPAGQELVRNSSIPPLPGTHSGLAVRVTASISIEGRYYINQNTFTLPYYHEPLPLPGIYLLDDGFEDATWDINWNDTASDWRDETTRVHTDSHAAGADRPDWVGYFTSDALDASDATAIHIRFWVQQDQAADGGGTVMFFRQVTITR